MLRACTTALTTKLGSKSLLLSRTYFGCCRYPMMQNLESINFTFIMSKFPMPMSTSGEKLSIIRVITGMVSNKVEFNGRLEYTSGPCCQLHFSNSLFNHYHLACYHWHLVHQQTFY
jgi:hypothetical protein